MDPRTAKLVKKGVEPIVAELLTEQGFDTPSKIRGATDTALKKALSTKQVQDIRRMIPKK